VRFLVCGGRDFDNYVLMAGVLSLFDWDPAYDVIVAGAARGADALAANYAKTHNLNLEEYPADWNANGKTAGVIRNQQMLDTGIDLVIAFPGGKGTADMKSRARKAGVTVLEVS
jgi:hypothetical protein